MSATAAASSGRPALSALQQRLLNHQKNPYWAHYQKKHQARKLEHRNYLRARGATDHKGKPIFIPSTWNITKGDMVQVTQASSIKDYGASGQPRQNQYGQVQTQKWFGQQGKVIRVIRNQERIIVEGINIKPRRITRSMQGEPGFQYWTESPIPYQHVTLVDPSTGQPVVGPIKRVKRDGVTVRVVSRTKTIIPTPVRDEPWKMKREVKTNERVDTKPEDVLAETYIKPEFTLPECERDENGQPKLTSSIVNMTEEEIKLLEKKWRKKTITKEEREMLRTGKKIQYSTIPIPEDIEARVCRIKF